MRSVCAAKFFILHLHINIILQHKRREFLKYPCLYLRKLNELDL